jgi:transposase-like protein
MLQALIAIKKAGHAPATVTADGHRSSPGAIRETLGAEVVHRTNVELTTRIEQDHRGINTGTIRCVAFTAFCRQRASIVPVTLYWLLGSFVQKHIL